ncbi:hypothetical protein EGT29_24690 [Pigmentiphaga sp. H8]|uniref:hypothetical protein n=1 Tax=Pigmentiphaga sp. H8 TaxID=2488560 RepID=UPI000F59C52F|nr:hypothetical protein [Pigmentiphaga sp. H8]AZG10826.1 hypothetical protein EGT29_24690 [Pigmentiphaga sp. H8]
MAKVEVSSSSDRSKIQAKAAQLSALMSLIHDASLEDFVSLAESDRVNILWLASDLAWEINQQINDLEKDHVD